MGTTRAPRMAGFGGTILRMAAVVSACAVALAFGDAAGQADRRPAEVRRSRPPAGKWEAANAEIFRPDAFSVLVGERPDFHQRRTVSPVPGPAPPAGFAWSTLISDDVLTDEIKGQRSVLAAACEKPSSFKGGGFEKAERALGSLAVAFGVIAEYDQKVRWKNHAAAARDRFAQAGRNCSVGSDQTFSEAKARLEELTELLNGNPLPGAPDRNGDFRWSEVAGRDVLMERLEEANDALQPVVSTKAEFDGNLDEFLHAVEIVAAVGEVIRRPDFEDHEDPSYLDHAAAMRDGATAARAAVANKDYEAARAAAGRIKKACSDCHAEYR